MIAYRWLHLAFLLAIADIRVAHIPLRFSATNNTSFLLGANADKVDK